jgi:uroporphyrinogen decarboxylase
MTGKELIRATFEHKQTDTIPWVPFAGVHAGKLKGYTARDISTDADKLYESLLEAEKVYHPDGMPVMFDLQIEAEILGCELIWSETAPPTVSSHPLEDSTEIPSEIPVPDDGRLGLHLSVMERLVGEIGDRVAVYGLLCGPFTLASHLRGTNVFMDMFDNAEHVHALLEYTTKIATAISGYFIDRGADVVAAVDPLVSQISPDHFSEFLSGPYSKLFASIREKNAFSSFFVCGDAGKNIEVMCKTEPDGISIDENIPFASAKEITDRYNIVLGGNIPLTTVMLFGNQQDNMKSVIDQIDSVSRKNLVVSPGCDMPYDIPVENAIAIEQAVHSPESSRKMIANYEAPADDTEVELPNYDALERPLIEVFTLDSDTCAACTYMFQSAMDAKKNYGESVDVVEYKFTRKEDIARIKKMGVQQLPSIYLNGELLYSSIIPSREALNKEIEKVLD